MDIEITFKDSEESEYPCCKEFKYNSKDGYSVKWAEGCEDLEFEEDVYNSEGEDEDED